MRHVHWHASYIKRTLMSHRSLCLYNTVDLDRCVYLRDRYASATSDLEGKKMKTVEHATPISFRSLMSPS